MLACYACRFFNSLDGANMFNSSFPVDVAIQCYKNCLVEPWGMITETNTLVVGTALGVLTLGAHCIGKIFTMRNTRYTRHNDETEMNRLNAEASGGPETPIPRNSNPQYTMVVVGSYLVSSTLVITSVFHKMITNPIEESCVNLCISVRDYIISNPPTP